MNDVMPRMLAAVLSILACQLAIAQARAQPSSLDDAVLTQVGTRYAAAINAGDAAALEDLFAFEVLSERVAETLTDNAAERSAYAQGFAQQARTLPQQWISEIQAQQGTARFLRVRSLRDMRGPLVRYDLAQGTNYVLLVLGSGDAAQPRIVDVFMASSGQLLSETLGVVSQLMIAPSESLLGRLFGGSSVDADLASTFTTLGRLYREGQPAEAYELLDTLPPEVRNHRAVLNFSVQVGNLLGEQAYREELARLAEHHHDNPSAAFLLLDHYFYTDQLGQAMDVVLEFERVFGPDAMLAMMKANVAMQSGDLSQAAEHARQSVDLEPGNEDGHWTLVTILMAAERYEDGIGVLESIEEQFGYLFDAASFEGNAVYAGFVQSPEFAAWAENR